MARIRFRQSSLQWLLQIDDYVRRYKVGTYQSVLEAPSDVLDSLANRAQLEDLIRRRVLMVIPLPLERDIEPLDRFICGWTWTVEFTHRAAQILYPEVSP